MLQNLFYVVQKYSKDIGYSKCHKNMADKVSAVKNIPSLLVHKNQMAFDGVDEKISSSWKFIHKVFKNIWFEP